MLTCTITSPAKTLIFNKLQSISLPAANGQMEILPGHAAAFVILKAGKIILKAANGKISQIENTTEAICHIADNQVIIAT